MNKPPLKRHFVALSLCLGLFSHLSGAVSADTLVKFPIGPAAWIIALKPHPSSVSVNAKDPSEVNMVSLEVTQDKEKTRTVIKYSNGENRTAWSFADLSLMMTHDPAGTVFFAPKSIPMSASAFAWLKAEFLQEKEPIGYGGTKCFHYQGKVTVPPLSPELTETSVIKEAWIDSTTLFPVALDDGTDQAIFTFQKAPLDEPLVLPPNYSKLLAIKRRILGLP